MNETDAVPELDFLPTDFRKRVADNKSHSRLALVLLAYAVFTGGLVVYQQLAERSVRARAAIVQPRYADAQQKNQRFVELQAEAAKAGDLADYCAYLQHPWPRSQIVAALLERLPPDVCLSEVDLTRERLPARGSAAAPPSQSTASAHDPKAPVAPTIREELQRLRDEVDGTRVVLHVRGVTTEPAALHACLAVLTRTRPFARAQLESLNAYRKDDVPNGTSFDMRLEVLPGYGQPSGPAPPSEHLAQKP